MSLTPKIIDLLKAIIMYINWQNISIAKRNKISS